MSGAVVSCGVLLRLRQDMCSFGRSLRGKATIGTLICWLRRPVPGLSMTRAFGDELAASVGVIAQPEMMEFQLSAQDKYLILCRCSRASGQASAAETC